jgi:hypothetical protein
VIEAHWQNVMAQSPATGCGERVVNRECGHRSYFLEWLFGTLRLLLVYLKKVYAAKLRVAAV